ncbi:hypothetical protein D5R81_11460 [Parashewanella spongiae]|uniref:Toprim domain-containing protein n=1 Tax=Parashewanella spongiae TaxID=342950 RepID=A0A3A6TL53_9GAMM|nr:LPD7 domain-containing protein [Parashewanella spongiae]MCL1078422.1 DUF5710 domain-containing protein [Parashewanella spongiae]RJY13303.1 hypothetical protein D5R81_11460 [Parashewanella spongiae]
MNDDAVLEQQTFLAVPYEKREQARKAIGQLPNGNNALSFDGDLGLWFARTGTPLSKVEPWLPNPDLFQTPTHQDPVIELSQILEASGFVLPESPIFDGQKHRVATQDDKRGQKSGVYCAYNDGHPAGWYQDHRNHSEPQKWSASFSHSDPLAKLHIKAHQANKRTLREITTAKRYQHYAKRCSQAFQLMPHAKVDQSYLVKKDVQPFPDVMQDKKGRLVIPLMDENHNIHSLQRISPNGFKCLKKAAQKTGHFFVVGYKPLKNGEPILYAEGYATAASIAEATNRSVVMTVDAGNMPKVAEKLKATYPDSQHLFLADDDRKNTINKGIEKARESANLTHGHLLSPSFIVDEQEAGMTDFNDLHISRGLGTVKSQIETYLERCWPQLKNKPKAAELNSITLVGEQAISPAETSKPKPANQQLNDQLKPLTKLGHTDAQTDENTENTKPIEPKPNTLPDRISKLYLEVDSKYYFSSRPKCLAFIDKGNKLQTKLSHTQVISDLLSIAKQRNWEFIKLSGTKAFKRQAWLQASVQNMNVRGYRPDKEDVKKLQALQAKSSVPATQAITPKDEQLNEIVQVKPSKPLDKQATLKAAQKFSQSLQPEAQKQFMKKVMHKLEHFFLKPQKTEHLSTQTIKEPQHDQQLEH